MYPELVHLLKQEEQRLEKVIEAIRYLLNCYDKPEVSDVPKATDPFLTQKEIAAARREKIFYWLSAHQRFASVDEIERAIFKGEPQTKRSLDKILRGLFNLQYAKNGKTVVRIFFSQRPGSKQYWWGISSWVVKGEIPKKHWPLNGWEPYAKKTAPVERDLSDIPKNPYNDFITQQKVYECLTAMDCFMKSEHISRSILHGHLAHHPIANYYIHQRLIRLKYKGLVVPYKHPQGGTWYGKKEWFLDGEPMKERLSVSWAPPLLTKVS